MRLSSATSHREPSLDILSVLRFCVTSRDLFPLAPAPPSLSLSRWALKESAIARFADRRDLYYLYSIRAKFVNCVDVDRRRLRFIFLTLQVRGENVTLRPRNNAGLTDQNRLAVVIAAGRARDFSAAFRNFVIRRSRLSPRAIPCYFQAFPRESFRYVKVTEIPERLKQQTTDSSCDAFIFSPIVGLNSRGITEKERNFVH